MVEQTLRYANKQMSHTLNDIMLIPYKYMSYHTSDLFSVWDNDKRIGTISIDDGKIGISLHCEDTIPLRSFYKDWTMFEAIEVIQCLSYRT